MSHQAASSQRLTVDDLRSAYAGYGRSRERWLIGGEFERHLLDAHGMPMVYDGHNGIRALIERFVAEGWRPYRERAALIAAFHERASITLEPGCQFELSGAPHRTVAGVIAEATRFADDVDRHLEGTGYTQVALGFTPFARIADIRFVPKGRYAIMRDHMSVSGPLGHHMMKGTAATQCSFDFSDEQDCGRKVRIATALAPLVTGMFANSPLSRGRPNGWHSYRGFIWTQTDPARTGFPDAADAFSYEAWVDYLLDVPMMFTAAGGDWRPARGRTFRQWMTDGIDGVFPSSADWDLHLTSVFPEVRVKSQIEVRMGDCVPLPLAASFCALFEGLFYCSQSLNEAIALSERFSRFGTKQERFLVACRTGLTGTVGGRPLAAWAEELVTAAREGLSRCAPDEVHWLDPLVELVSHGETPASRLLAALGDDLSPGHVRELTDIHGHPAIG